MFTHDKEDGSLSVWVAVRYSTVSHEVNVSKCSREMAVALFKVAAKTPKHRRSRQKMHMARYM